MLNILIYSISTQYWPPNTKDFSLKNQCSSLGCYFCAKDAFFRAYHVPLFSAEPLYQNVCIDHRKKPTSLRCVSDLFMKRKFCNSKLKLRVSEPKSTIVGNKFNIIDPIDIIDHNELLIEYLFVISPFIYSIIETLS